MKARTLSLYKTSAEKIKKQPLQESSLNEGMKVKQGGPGNQYLTWLQYIVYGSVLLYFGRNIFIPLSFAMLISFVLYPICLKLENKGFSRLSATIASMSILMLLGLLLVGLLVYQLFGFLSEWSSIQAKLILLLADFSQMLIDTFGISKEQQSGFFSRLSDHTGNNVLTMIGNALSASVFSTIQLILVPIYSVLILYYRNYWMQVLYRIFRWEKSENIRKIIGLTIKTYYNFIGGVLIVYFVVGTLNSIGLLLLGIPHAILFGFIASVLTFIPYIGIIAGSLLPMAVAWITYDSFWYPLGIVAIFTFVQYLEANLIFPLAVSKRLNVNMLVMLLAIFAGGIIWGVAGMILFVPYIGIAKLIADHYPKWKSVAMILGTGK